MPGRFTARCATAHAALAAFVSSGSALR